jgi:hypothetical protein
MELVKAGKLTLKEAREKIGAFNRQAKQSGQEISKRHGDSSIRHECRRYQMVCTHCFDRDQEEALIFLKTSTDPGRILAEDVRGGYQVDSAVKSFDEIIFGSRASYPKDSLNPKDDGRIWT